jgi:hypothetical protein
MMSVRSNRWNAWQGKPKYSEKTCSSAALSLQIRHDLTRASAIGKPATKCLSYDKAIELLKLTTHLHLVAKPRMHIPLATPPLHLYGLSTETNSLLTCTKIRISIFLPIFERIYVNFNLYDITYPIIARVRRADSPPTRGRRSIGSGGESSSMLTSVEGNAVMLL